MRWGKKPICWVGVSAVFLMATWLSAAQAQLLLDHLADADGERLFENPSPRLGGMGLLGIAVEDENNEINLFDYIGSPAGLLADRDSTSIDFQYDFARSKTDWKGVDPYAYSPAGPIWPNFIDFGSANLETRYGYQRFQFLSAYRNLRKGLSLGARVDYVRSERAIDVTKFDVTYITSVGEAEEAVPETLFVGQASRDSVSAVRSWVFDILADKEVGSGLQVAGHAIFSFEEMKPRIYHSPDSITVQMARPVVVDTTTDPNGATRLRAIPNPRSSAEGVGGGIAFSYELGKYVTLGMSGDIFSTDETVTLRGPFFRQEMTRDAFYKTANFHSLVKLGEALEGAVKHQSRNMSGDGSYFWSFGCPVQGGDYTPATAKGKTADRDGWEERTGTRWLVRVPETSIRLAMEYESARGRFEVDPDSAYGGHVFVVPGECSAGEIAPQFPRYAVLIDTEAEKLDFEEKDFSVGASLTLWFDWRPLTLATEYESNRMDVFASGAVGLERKLALIKIGSEFGLTRKIKVRAGGVWGRDEMEPLGEGWDEGILTLGGTYVLAPGLRHIEVAYMYKDRKPDLNDVFDRETADHRLTAYTRIFF